MSDILGKLFNIKTGFYGVLISNFARLNLSSIVDEANDKHMKPWNELCARNNIRATPLDPYMDKELLSSNHLYIDGTGISTKTGFKYKYDKISIDLIKEVLISRDKTKTSEPTLHIQAKAIIASSHPVIKPPCTILPE